MRVAMPSWSAMGRCGRAARQWGLGRSRPEVPRVNDQCVVVGVVTQYYRSLSQCRNDPEIVRDEQHRLAFSRDISHFAQHLV